MASYSLSARRSFEKALQKLPAETVQLIIERTRQLADNPFGPNTKKLKGAKQLYRLRVGIYRVVYSVDTKGRIIVLMLVGHRKDIYRNLK
ncbi:type II toxin-antitoxin system RelE/ParE family toxin [soil metagenome]